MNATDETPGPARQSGATRRKVRDRVAELVRVRAGDLAENPANWRRHPPSQRAALRGLLRQIGYADALLARREGDRLILVDGHLRQSLDPDQVVPVLVLDVTEAEADTLLATLDPLASMASADPGALQQLLDRVEPASAGVRELLEGLRRDAGLPLLRALADPEDIPEPPRRSRMARGGVFEVAGQRVMCGDAASPEDLATLMGGRLAECCLTDPPYGVSYTGKTRAALTIQGDEAEGLAHLLSTSFAAVDTVLAPGARIYVCHPAGALSGVFIQAFLAQGWHLAQTLVWVKDAMVLGHGDYHYRHEPILYGHAAGGGRRGRGQAGWYGGNAETSVLEFPRPKASTTHPTAKPVALAARMLRNSTREGDAVVDPFAGSGSSLVASALHGRRGHGMEIDPRYCEVILRRLEELSGERAQRVNRRGTSRRR